MVAGASSYCLPPETTVGPFRARLAGWSDGRGGSATTSSIACRPTIAGADVQYGYSRRIRSATVPSLLYFEVSKKF